MQALIYEYYAAFPFLPEPDDDMIVDMVRVWGNILCDVPSDKLLPAFYRAAQQWNLASAMPPGQILKAYREMPRDDTRNNKQQDEKPKQSGPGIEIMSGWLAADIVSVKRLLGLDISGTNMFVPWEVGKLLDGRFSAAGAQKIDTAETKIICDTRQSREHHKLVHPVYYWPPEDSNGRGDYLCVLCSAMRMIGQEWPPVGESVSIRLAAGNAEASNEPAHRPEAGDEHEKRLQEFFEKYGKPVG